MFQRRKLESAVAAAIQSQPPQRTNTTIHNNPPNYALLILIGVAAVPILAVLTWWALVYLMDTLGAPQPERAAAHVVVVLTILSIVAILATLIANAFLTRWLEYKKELADITGQWKYKQLMAQRQPVGNSRTLSEDLRLVRLIEIIMTEAYDHLEDHGQYTKNDAKPWSREQAKKRVLLNEKEPVGWTLGSQVRSWLQAKSVLRGDLINVAQFPDLGSVQELLRLEFEIPIEVNPRPLRNSVGYDFIENA